MTIEACAIERLKEFKFRVEINGYMVAAVQEFNPGKRSTEVTEHAGAGQNHTCKEAGMVKFENARLRNVVAISGEGGRFWEDWLNTAQDPNTGNGQSKSQYQKSFSFYELGPDGNTVREWTFYGAFPVVDDLGNRSALVGNKDVIEEIEIAYARRKQVR